MNGCNYFPSFGQKECERYCANAALKGRIAGLQIAGKKCVYGVSKQTMTKHLNRPLTGKNMNKL